MTSAAHVDPVQAPGVTDAPDDADDSDDSNDSDDSAAVAKPALRDADGAAW
jgi:hypothetical protein